MNICYTTDSSEIVDILQRLIQNIRAGYVDASYARFAPETDDVYGSLEISFVGSLEI